MNQDKLDKIKILIQTSPLLNSTERSDWMNLLELMNDKQVLELEKILSYGPKPAAAASGAPKPSSAPFSLSHIMNFPTNIPSVAPQESPVRNAQENTRITTAPVMSPGTNVRPSSQPKPSKFGSWLKNVVTEKELPPPAPADKTEKKLLIEPPVEIKKPAALPVAAPVIKPPMQKPGPEEVVVKEPTPVIIIQTPVQPVQTEKPAPATPQPVQPEPAVAKPVLAKEKLKMVPEQPAGKLAETNITISDLAKKASPVEYNRSRQQEKDASLQSLQHRSAPVRHSGLVNIPQNFYETVAGEALQARAVDPVPAEPIKPTAPVPIPPRPVSSDKSTGAPGFTEGPVKILDGLAPISSLSLAEMREKGAESLVSLLRSGMATFGYHKTVQALEQSPLYKAYIDTGLQLLSSGKSFEDLAATNPLDPKRHFSRTEFEDFTDALRETPATMQK